MNKRTATVLTSIAAFTLAACGGGGDEETVNTDPQGYWSGPASTGYNVSAVVLENGETWGVYTSGTTIFGALYGTASTSGGSISISGTDFNFLTNSASAGRLTGSVAAKQSMSLSGEGVTVNLSYDATYDSPATSAAATGTWDFTGRSGSYSLIPGTITIDSAGQFNLSQTDCITTGSFVPRANGKNVYNVALSSVGAGCAVGQSSLSGVAYLDTSTLPNRFLALGLTPSRGDGLVVIGTKR